MVPNGAAIVPQEDRMLDLVPLRGRPDLRTQVFSEAFLALWPTFVVKDPAADLFFEEPHLDACLDTAFAVVDPARPGTAVGRAFAVPFALEGMPGRAELPDSGWDGVVRWAHTDRALGRPADALSALELTLLPSHRGRGASRVVLGAMRRRAAELGLRHMFAPVRPTAKHLEPFAPMAEYAARTTADGLPADPWLRVHVRAGGRVEKVAPTSMVVPGTIAEWRRWTGLAFDTSGPVVVPGALVPVHVSLEQDHAVYVEPNVWVRHTVPG
jgi:GNAT superfamily N-acetyltransferase